MAQDKRPTETQGVQHRDAAATARALDAIRLRCAGLTYEQIAQQVGYGSRGACYKAIQRELANNAAHGVEDYRREEVARLDVLLAAVWDAATKPKTNTRTKQKGVNLFAVDRALAISEARRKLLGLDVPTNQPALAAQVIIREYGGINPEEV